MLILIIENILNLDKMVQKSKIIFPSNYLENFV